MAITEEVLKAIVKSAVQEGVQPVRTELRDACNHMEQRQDALTAEVKALTTRVANIEDGSGSKGFCADSDGLADDARSDSCPGGYHPRRLWLGGLEGKWSASAINRFLRAAGVTVCDEAEIRHVFSLPLRSWGLVTFSSRAQALAVEASLKDQVARGTKHRLGHFEFTLKIRMDRGKQARKPFIGKVYQAAEALMLQRFQSLDGVELTSTSVRGRKLLLASRGDEITEMASWVERSDELRTQ